MADTIPAISATPSFEAELAARLARLAMPVAVQAHTQLMIPLNKVLVKPGRGRKDFPNIPALAQSLRTVGLLHPIVVEPVSDSTDPAKVGCYYLVAGERRLRAALMAGWAEIPCNLRKDLDALTHKEIELEENVARQDLDWPERIELTRQIDELKKIKYGSRHHQGTEILLDDAGQPKVWTIADTAKVMNMPTGTAKVHIALAKRMKERPDLADRVRGLPAPRASKELDRLLACEQTSRLQASGQLKVANDIRRGDSLLLIKEVPDNSVDCIVTDPPYGNPNLVEQGGDTGTGEAGSNSSYKALIKTSDNLDPKSAMELWRNIVPDMFRVLKPGCHFYCFFSMDLYQEVTSPLLASGFQLHQPATLIWFKNRPTNAFNGYNYMACYEPIIFGWKPPRTKVLSEPMKTILTVSPVPVKDRIHVFQKPAELLSMLIRQSTQIGDLVLDPFSGSGETVTTALSLSRSGLGFEIDESHWLDSQRKINEMRRMAAMAGMVKGSML
jgi:DNA modification methylase